MTTARLCCLLLVLAAAWGLTGTAQTRPAATASAPAEGKEWTILRDKEFAMIIPRGWRNMKELPVPLYLNGDGIGLPAVDETGSPIQIGISIERWPNQKGAALDGAKRNLEAAQGQPLLEPVGQGKVEPIKLADGTDAAYLSIEFIKERTRRSLQQKVFALDGNSTGWVVIGWIVTGKDSRIIAYRPLLAATLRAHLSSIVFDQDKLSDAGVGAAYAAMEHPATRPAPQPPTRPAVP